MTCTCVRFAFENPKVLFVSWERAELSKQKCVGEQVSSRINIYSIIFLHFDSRSSLNSDLSLSINHTFCRCKQYTRYKGLFAITHRGDDTRLCPRSAASRYSQRPSKNSLRKIPRKKTFCENRRFDTFLHEAHSLLKGRLCCFRQSSIVDGKKRTNGKCFPPLRRPEACHA